MSKEQQLFIAICKNRHGQIVAAFDMVESFWIVCKESLPGFTTDDVDNGVLLQSYSLTSPCTLCLERDRQRKFTLTFTHSDGRIVEHRKVELPFEEEKIDFICLRDIADPYIPIQDYLLVEFVSLYPRIMPQDQA